MTCTDFLDGFSDYLDGAVPGPRGSEFESHLESCEECARYARVLKEGLGILGGLELDVPSDFRDRLERRIALDADDARSGFGPLGSAVTTRTVGAVTVLLAIAAWSPTVLGTPATNTTTTAGSAIETTLDPLAAGQLSAPLPEATQLWSYPNALMYEYSSLGRSNRPTVDRDRVVRAVGLE